MHREGFPSVQLLQDALDLAAETAFAGLLSAQEEHEPDLKRSSFGHFQVRVMDDRVIAKDRIPEFGRRFSPDREQHRMHALAVLLLGLLSMLQFGGEARIKKRFRLFSDLKRHIGEFIDVHIKTLTLFQLAFR